MLGDRCVFRWAAAAPVHSGLVALLTPLLIVRLRAWIVLQLSLHRSLAYPAPGEMRTTDGSGWWLDVDEGQARAHTHRARSLSNTAPRCSSPLCTAMASAQSGVQREAIRMRVIERQLAWFGSQCAR